MLSLAQKIIHGPKGQSRPEWVFDAWKGIFGPKEHAWPESAFVARKGITDQKGIIGRIGHSCPKSAL